MATSFTAPQVAGIGVAVALAAGAVTYFIVAEETERREVTIRLQAGPGNTPCHAVEPLPLMSKHLKHLTWHIDNQCSTAQFVELKNFAPVDDNGNVGAPENGVVDGNVVNRATAFPPGVTTGGLQTDPRKDIRPKKKASYKYEIWISAALPTSRSLDPDIEWWK